MILIQRRNLPAALLWQAGRRGILPKCSRLPLPKVAFQLLQAGPPKSSGRRRIKIIMAIIENFMIFIYITLIKNSIL